MEKKKKILTISDHPLITSGVGIQTRYIIEGMLKTGKYCVRSWGGALKHVDYRPIKVFPELYGDDGWIIYPIDGYGDRDRMRQFILHEKPDVLFFVTDPRFYMWLFEMSDEIRNNMPTVYWHVWDNDPTPEYNQQYYECIDSLIPLSHKTYGLVQDMQRKGLYDGYNKLITHAIPSDQFKIVDPVEVQHFRNQRFGPHADKKFVLFWNNRNARRKQPGDVIEIFSKFLNHAGKDNAALLMQTQPKDPEGQDLIVIAKKFGVDANMIISEARISAEDMNMFYNAADCTINIASAEGFGLGTLESIMCGTPVVLHMTGGMQFQIGDWWQDQEFFGDQEHLTKLAKDRWTKKQGNWFGAPVFPASRSCVGGQSITPYIYEDRINSDDAVKSLVKLYDMGRIARKELGVKGREWAQKTFNFDKMIKDFDEVFEHTINNFKRPTPRIISL